MKLLTLEDKTIWNEAVDSGCSAIRFNHRLKRWIVLDKDPCPHCPDVSCENTGNQIVSAETTIIIKTKKDGATNEAVQC